MPSATRHKHALVNYSPEPNDAPHAGEAGNGEQEDDDEVVVLGAPGEMHHPGDGLVQHPVRPVQVVVEVAQQAVLVAHLGADLDRQRPQQAHPVLQLGGEGLVLLLLEIAAQVSHGARLPGVGRHRPRVAHLLVGAHRAARSAHYTGSFRVRPAGCVSLPVIEPRPARREYPQAAPRRGRARGGEAGQAVRAALASRRDPGSARRHSPQSLWTLVPCRPCHGLPCRPRGLPYRKPVALDALWERKAEQSAQSTRR